MKPARAVLPDGNGVNVKIDPNLSTGYKLTGIEFPPLKNWKITRITERKNIVIYELGI